MAITQGQNANASDFINESEQDGTRANDAGRVPKLESDGYLAGSFFPKHFGDGSDGDVTIAVPTSLSKDMYYNDLTVNSTLTTNGYRIFVAGTLSGSGTIKYPDGNAGSNGTSSAGAGGAAYTAGGPLVNREGSAGGDAAVGVVGQAGYLGNGGGAGGAGSNGGGVAFAGGASGANLSKQLFGIEYWSVCSLTELTSSGLVFRSTRGAGGGGGDNSGSGAGGGGGASGGIVWIAAKLWAGTFTIQAIGGNGGNGAATGNTGGGGGGGAGGVAIVIYEKKTWTGSFNLAAGAGGAAGGAPGSAGGSAGGAGTSYQIPVHTLF